MPAVFAPAEPVSTSISAGYGAAQEWDKQFPVLAGLYESAGHLQQQAYQAAAQRGQQAQIAQAQINSRQLEQRQAEDFQAAQQQQQLRAQKDLQLQRFALQGQQITQQETDHANQLQAGINEVLRQKAQGNLSDEEATGLVVQMKTGLDLFKQRQENQRAQDFAAQADLRRKQLSLEVQNMEDAKAFQLDAADHGHTLQPFTDPTTGKQHMLAMDKDGKFYNPFLEHATKAGQEGPDPDQPWGQFATKDGHFDAPKALKDTEARAKALFPEKFEKAAGETGKGQDVNAEERHDWIKRRMEGIEAEFSGRQTPSQEAFSMRRQAKQRQQAAAGITPNNPPRDDTQPAQPSAPPDPAAAAIASHPKLSTEDKMKANGLLAEARSLAGKVRSPEEAKRFAELRDQLRKYLGD